MRPYFFSDYFKTCPFSNAVRQYHDFFFFKVKTYFQQDEDLSLPWQCEKLEAESKRTRCKSEEVELEIPGSAGSEGGLAHG